jgi:hypothetical protein
MRLFSPAAPAPASSPFKAPLLRGRILFASPEAPPPVDSQPTLRRSDRLSGGSSGSRDSGRAAAVAAPAAVRPPAVVRRPSGLSGLALGAALGEARALAPEPRRSADALSAGAGKRTRAAAAFTAARPAEHAAGGEAASAHVLAPPPGADDAGSRQERLAQWRAQRAADTKPKPAPAAKRPAAAPAASGAGRVRAGGGGGGGGGGGLALELDAGVMAMLAEHNKKYKPAAAYVPRQHSVRDIKQVRGAPACTARADGAHSGRRRPVASGTTSARPSARPPTRRSRG